MCAEHLNILLVDDDPATCQLVKRVLTRSVVGTICNVVTASTLSNAIEHLNQERFDNVLLDLGLPDSRGVQTVKSIHSYDPTVPIVVLTALPDKDVEFEARREGADDYLVKGIDVWQSLVSHIRFAIENKKVSGCVRREYEDLKAVFNSLPMPIFILSPQGRVLQYNSASDELTGFIAREYAGRDFGEIFSDDRSRKLFSRSLQQLRDDVQCDTIAAAIKRENGEKMLCRMDVKAVKDNDGQIRQFTVIAAEMKPSGLGWDTKLFSEHERPVARRLNPEDLPRVLVIEAMSESQIFLTSTLREIGLDVTPVQDSSHAAQLAQNHPFDTIVIDIASPDQQVLSAIHQMRLDCVDTPIIAICQPDIYETTVNVEDISVLVPKPVSRKQIYEVLSHYLTLPAGVC